jgi:O-antigen/teichoic acid export membrane protein
VNSLGENVEPGVERALLALPEVPVPVEPRRTIEQPSVRFAVTFAANVARAGISFLTGVFIARALGANRYGELNFLLGSLAAVTQLLDAGSTSAFYTLLSARRRTPAFFGVYFAWTFGVQFVGTILVVGAILPRQLIASLWIGHDRGIVLLAFVASFMVSQTWSTATQMGEAARKTVIVQIAATCQAVLHLILVLALIALHLLTVRTVLWLITIDYFAVALILAPKMLKLNLRGGAPEPPRQTIGEFVTFCKPIVVYVIIGFLYQFADRWLLQRFGGSVQQGFFSVGQQFSTISLLATTSILAVFWKEIAEANVLGDRKKVAQVYMTVRRLVYFAAAAISCALIPYSRDILHWTLGGSYEGGALCLTLMLLFPIHQTLGQVQGTFFFAIGDTGRYVVVGLIFMIVSIPITYIMVAPRDSRIPGLALGAVGFALKMVILNIAAIVAQMILLRRSHALQFDFGYQALVVGTLLAVSWAVKVLVAYSLALVGFGSLVALIAGIAVYVFIVGLVVLQRPSIAGVSQPQIDFALAKAHRLFSWRLRRA